MENNNLMDKVVSLAKQRGFVFPGSEIYGGLANSWDFGPLGVELKNNIKKNWWKTFVQGRQDIIGMDGAVIMNPQTWKASGHLENFTDPLVECKNCRNRFRGDKLLEDKFGVEKYAGIKMEEIAETLISNKIICPTCGKAEWAEPKKFNLMFKTFIGSTEETSNVAYLRPETAQAIFVDFPILAQVSRRKMPFGIAQIGKSFRNEITPGNFIFRTREFEQMEIEYFFNPEDDWNEYFDQWLEELKKWMNQVGIDESKLFFHDIPEDERAHYSQKTIDVEFDFPFGKKELMGLAYRKDYDLSQHKVDYTDPLTMKKYVPHVIEPSLGVERAMLAILISAYTEEEAQSAEGKAEKRVVLKLKKEVAPIKVAILPLSKKPELEDVAKKIWSGLSKKVMTDYDITGSIGKRYRRQDEIGTPYCVTVDFETLEDEAVTVRDRDTMQQERIKITELEGYIINKLNE